jgi:hypothetical protein
MWLSPSLVPGRYEITPSLLVLGGEMKAAPREKLSSLLADTFLLRRGNGDSTLTSPKLDNRFRRIRTTQVRTQEEGSSGPKSDSPSPHPYFLH